MTQDPGTDRRELRAGGELLGVLEQKGTRSTLKVDSPVATIERSERAVSPRRPYPRRVVTEGRLKEGGHTVRQEYVLLAPPAPLRVEGLGLEVSTDEPGLNADEHRELRDWLESQGLPGDTGNFEKLHFADAGRELTVWYEISGRRVSGKLTRGRSPEPDARFDSLFHVENGGWKIHHKRTGENGRFRYHRRSLELVDTLLDVRTGRELRSYHCGCYGYAIASDWATLGDSHLFHVEVDWLNDRVAAGFFVGWERKESFPWIRIGDRRRTRDLARRAKAFRLTDAESRVFAELAIRFPTDPSGDELGATAYEMRVARSEGRLVRLARIEHAPGEVLVHLGTASATDAVRPDGSPDWAVPLEQLDTLLAAMPTQVVRGDGIRDSHLGEIETMLDWIRLMQEPSEEHLADVVSEIDALTAISKVHTLLETDGLTFAPAGQEVPLPPRRYPASPNARGSRTRESKLDPIR
jgi:hypothetical protein